MTVRRTVPQSVIDQASAWVVRLGGDEISDADYEGLQAWLDLSPDHRPAFDEAQGLWAALEGDRAALDVALTRSAPMAAPVAALVRRSSNRAGMSRRWVWGAGAAAAAAGAFAILIGPSLGGRTVVYVTAPGEQRTVDLADGSTIVMNGGSTLSVRLSGHERLVEMADAEAAFDVARDANRPFRVSVGESRVEVLGTAFDIRRDATTTRVNVTRGVVRVSDLADASRSVRLTAGQAVARPDATGELQVTTGSIGDAGWRAGQLIYDNRPLLEIIDDLNRAYPTPIRAVGGAGELRFTGVLALDGQAETLRRLESFLPVSVERGEDVIELRPR